MNPSVPAAFMFHHYGDTQPGAEQLVARELAVNT